jgi:hypothetical protein
MLSLGGVHHLTGGSTKEGVVTCDTMHRLANADPIDRGATVTVQSGQPPIVDGIAEQGLGRSYAIKPENFGEDGSPLQLPAL